MQSSLHGGNRVQYVNQFSRYNMLNKPFKKKKSTKEVKEGKRKLVDNSKMLSRELSHAILTQPKPKHKRQYSHVPTNSQSTSQKLTFPGDTSHRKLLQSSTKKLTSKSRKSIKQTRVKKFQSYLLYIDTQFSLFSEQTKSKISEESTDVRRQVSSVEEKDDLIQLIKKYKRDYISQSRSSQFEKNQSQKDKAANNIKGKWKLYRTRKLITKYIKLNKIRQRPENIPSNINKLQDIHNILSIQTLKSQEQAAVLPPILPHYSDQFPDMMVQIPEASAIENLKLKQVQEILLKQKQKIRQKYQAQIEGVQKSFREKELTKEEYQKSLKNANKFMGLRLAQINQSILNVRKLSAQTDNLLYEIHSNNVANSSPLHCMSQKNIHSEQTTKDKKSESTKDKDQIVDFLVDQLLGQFCKETQRHPYIQKIIIESFADWKIGVECNEEAIDLFCQNLIQYTLSSQADPFGNLKVALGCTPVQLLKLHHTQDFQPDKEEDVVSDLIFRDFSKIMVFPLRSKNSPQQLSIVRLIEILNHYHNRAIFQALNEALDYERIYGIDGKPLPWKPQPNFKRFHLYQSLSAAVDKVMSYQEWRCGFHPQNFFSLRQGLTMRNLSMVRDQRLNRLMQVQQRQLEPYWRNDLMQETFLFLDVDHLLYDFVLIEVVLELQLIVQTR